MFLHLPVEDDEVRRLYQADLDDDGYVMNLTRLWAWRPEVCQAFIELRGMVTNASSLSPRELALIVTATASTLGDAYCSLAWGNKLAAVSEPVTAAAILIGGLPGALSPREATLVRWVRKVAKDPNGTTSADVEALRTGGFSDREIFEATAFCALRLAFSTVNDALGALPDARLVENAPPEVRAAVTYGRPAAAPPAADGPRR